MKNRTSQQNKALHLWIELMAKELRSEGQTMNTILKFDIPCTPYNFKEYIWRPVQEAYMKERSTTKLTTQDINVIYEVISKELSTRAGVYIPFPSVEQLMEYEDK